MNVIYAGQAFPAEEHSSLFLAGPSPRSPEVRSWRPRAIRWLRTLGYGGTVYVPEPRKGAWPSYDHQVEWERDAMDRSDLVVFWIPRNMQTLPGLTTNQELGHWLARDAGRVVLGTPKNAPHVRYQRKHAVFRGLSPFHTLPDTLRHALSLLGEGSLRRGGACEVPLHLWKTPSFYAWFQQQGELLGAKVEWVYEVGTRNPMLFALHVRVRVEGTLAQDRVVVFSSRILLHSFNQTPSIPVGAIDQGKCV